MVETIIQKHLQCGWLLHTQLLLNYLPEYLLKPILYYQAKQHLFH